MDNTNDYLIPGLNFLSLDDSPNHSQWHSGGPTTQTPQVHAYEGYPQFTQAGHSPKSIQDESVYSGYLTDFSRPKAVGLQFPISPPPTNSQPKRSVPLPAFQASPEKPPLSMPFTRPFGGVLDSPLIYKHVGLNGHHALISPPPTLPTTTRTLPPTDSPHLRVIPEHEDFLSGREEDHDDHDNRLHDPSEFQLSLLGLSSPRSHPVDLYGGSSMPTTSTQSNPLLSPISPDWSTARIPSDTSSPSYPYYASMEEVNDAGNSILLQHRPESSGFSTHGLERSNTPQAYDVPFSPSSSPFSRPILPPLDMSSLLDTPPPDSYELSDDASPPSPPHTALAPGHPFIRDHSTSFVDGHDPRRLYTQKRRYLRNPQISPSSPPNPIDQEELSVLSPFDYGYDSKPIKVFDDVPEDDGMDLEDDQLQEVLLATPEPPSPKPLAPLDPPPISEYRDAHEFTPGETPWSPSLRGFSDLPDLDDEEDLEDGDYGSASDSPFMDIDRFMESPKPSLLSLPGADTDEDLIPLDGPLSAPGVGFWDHHSQMHEEPTFWPPELDSNPFLGGSSSSSSGSSSASSSSTTSAGSGSSSSYAHRTPRSSISLSSGVHHRGTPHSLRSKIFASPPPYDLHTFTPGPASSSSSSGSSAKPLSPLSNSSLSPRTTPSPSKRRSLLLVDEDMMEDDIDPDSELHDESDADADSDLLFPPWRSSISGGRERDEEDMVIRQADKSSDPELRRLSELMKKALKAERDARDAETRVLSGGSIGGSGDSVTGGVGYWEGRAVPRPTSSLPSMSSPSTITRGAGIDMAARREARKAKKKARDRAREIGSMMKLKMAEIGSSPASTVTSGDSSPEAACAASRASLSMGVKGKKQRRKGTLGEARSMDQLVAKMMLRRHETYRTLANRKTPLAPGRRYESSPLIRTRELPAVEEPESAEDEESKSEGVAMEGVLGDDSESDPWTMEQD